MMWGYEQATSTYKQVLRSKEHIEVRFRIGISALERLKQQDCQEFETSYEERLCIKTQGEKSLRVKISQVKEIEGWGRKGTVSN